MASVNSRQKGKRRELAWVKVLGKHGFNARRTQQFNGAATDGQMDVESDGPVTQWEVKGRERLAVHDTVARAVSEAGGLRTAVAWKKNRSEWVVAMDGTQFLEMLSELRSSAHT